MTFIDTDKSPDDAREQEADRFASNLLIPPYRASELEFLDKTGNSVRAIASSIGVAPGIVVGRMQKEGYLPWTHLNSLKVRYTWN